MKSLIIAVIIAALTSCSSSDTTEATKPDTTVRVVDQKPRSGEAKYLVQGANVKKWKKIVILDTLYHIGDTITLGDSNIEWVIVR